jgi:hypothetical protein
MSSLWPTSSNPGSGVAQLLQKHAVSVFSESRLGHFHITVAPLLNNTRIFISKRTVKFNVRWVPIDVAVELGITTIEHAKAPWPYVLKDEYRIEHDTLIWPDADPKQRMKFRQQMAELGIASISEKRLQDLSYLMIENNAVLCPTLWVFKDWEEEDQTGEVKGEITEEQNSRKKRVTGLIAVNEYFVRMLSANGVKLLVGQDNNDAIGTLEEMILMKAAGVTDVEVLKGATIYAAEWLELDDKYGAVEPGKIADLLLLNSNPLDNIAHVGEVFMVIQHGEIVKK